MAEAKWSGVLSTTEPRNDIGILNVRQGNLNSEIVEFQIIQNNKPYDLTGTKVYFCTNFGLSAVEKAAIIKDASKGIITFTFNDQSMQEVGRQMAYFQIKKDETLIDSTQDFEFRIESSIFSRLMEGGSYIERFENILKTLGDNAAYELSKSVIEILELLSQKANISYVDAILMDIAKGGPNSGPQGPFMSIAALKAYDYPDGKEGTWLVFDSSFADGAHSFMWDSTNSVWKDLGVYQGIALPDKSVTTKKIGEKAVTSEKTEFLTDGLAEDNVRNIMPNTLSVKGDFYDPSNGHFTNDTSTQNFKNTGKRFYTEKGIIECYGVNSLLFFDTSDTFISSTQHGSDSDLMVKRRIQPPINTNYFIANIPKAYWWDNDDLEFPNLTATLRFIPTKSKMKTLRVTEDNFEKVVDSNFSPKDVLSSMTFSEVGKAVDVTNGNAIFQAGKKHTMWNDVLPVTYKSLGLSHILFKMSDGTFLKQYYNFSSDEALAAWQTWTPPVGATKMAFNLVTYYFERAELFQMTSNEELNTVKNLAVERRIDKNERFKGLTEVDMGDSLTSGNGYPSDVSTVVANELNINVTNAGFGGTRAAVHPSEHYNNFSLFKLVDAIVAKDFSAQEASAQVTGISMPSYYKTKVAVLKGIDFKKVAILKIGYGTNDWNGVVQLDNPLDPLDTTTYLGALRYSIIKLLQNYPHLKIVLTTPIYRFKEDGSADSDDWIAGDKKLTDFVDAMIALGRELKLPVIDCYYSLGINKYNRLQYFPPTDGTHMNYTGRKLMGHKHAVGIRNAY